MRERKSNYSFNLNHSFPNAVWERKCAKRCFALDANNIINRLFYPQHRTTALCWYCVPKQRLGTSETYI